MPPEILRIMIKKKLVEKIVTNMFIKKYYPPTRIFIRVRPYLNLDLIVLKACGFISIINFSLRQHRLFLVFN